MTAFPRSALESSVPERFAMVASAHARRPAIVWEQGEWTYAALRERVDALARQICEGGGSAHPVLVLLGHGADEIAAMLACLTAGHAYVVLDPDSPPAHLRAIAADVGADRIVSCDAHREIASALAAAVIDVERDDTVDVAPGTSISPDDVAAIVYTSGSTGEPKGVMRSHRCVLHRSWLFREEQQLRCEDRVAHLYSCSFVAAEVELFGALLNGATLCSYPVRSLGIAPLADWLVRERITSLHPPPTLFRRFLDGLDGPLVGSALRTVTLAGESVFRSDLERIRQLLPGCRLQHRFSSSETSVATRLIVGTGAPIGNDEILPAGLPVADKDVRIVDEAGRLVAAGEVGEIEVRSRYLASGYWRRPELTRQRFRVAVDGVTHCVRTGDLGFWRADGMLQHCGRVDRQLKVNGYRVEPEQVECALLARDTITEAAVVPNPNARGEARLTAWIVTERPQVDTASALRRWLLERMPSYMVPARFGFLAELPTTRSGKVDRPALAARQSEVRSTALSRSAPDARDGLEYQLRVLWHDVLERRGIGTSDDFFDLGGDSLQLAEMMVGIERLFGAVPSLAEFVAAPTIAALVQQLRGKRPIASYRYLVPMRIGGDAPPFFCVHPMSGSALHFVNLARHFEASRSFYALQARGIDGRGAPHASVEEMAADYLTEIRRKQPHGPYHIGGLCLGADVAVEMARVLLAAGEEVAIVAVFDTEGRSKPKEASGWKRLKRAVKRLRQARTARPRELEESYAWRLRQAGKRYRPEPFPGTVTLFTTDAGRAQSEQNWGALTEGRLEIESIPGEHYTAMREPHVRAVAKRLEARLAQASLEQRCDST